MIEVSKIKEILCLHHSHLDIGYTHPQPLLMELQLDYIDEAIDLCQQTKNFPEESKFRWTCEATYPVLKWLETASDERVQLFEKFLHNGQLSISAMMMHTTPLNNHHQMERMLYPIKELRERFGIKINTAINHDVNGQPWPMSQVLLDAGVDFYITGINVHFGGIPFKRPTAFKWQTPDERELLTFQGEHYSLFSQFFETSKADTSLMAKGISEYVQRLEKNGYEHEFIFLTSTNPPLFDNNCPDPELPHLIQKYNDEGHDYKIRFVTPEMLLKKVNTLDPDQIPVHSGDWTDYWNFGSGSSARETRLNRKTKQGLKKAEFLEAFQGSPCTQYDRVKGESVLNMLLYEEHTWGAAQSITDPDDPEVYSQRTHKSHMAYQAADLSAYVLGKQMETLAGNPTQSTEPEGIILVNTSNVDQQVAVHLPEEYKEEGRHLSALRSKQYLPYSKDMEETEYYGMVKLSPFSWKKIPFTALEQLKETNESKSYTILDDAIETPFYRMTFDSNTGRIKELYNKTREWSMLDETSDWTLFEFIRESIDPLYNAEERDTFFPRDIDLGNQSISVWNHQWKAKRTGANQIISWDIEKTKDTVTFKMNIEAEGVKSLEQRITFSIHHPRITFDAVIDKEDVRTPESIYFAFPLNIEKDWRCHYDTAGMFVELDEEQMGTVSKDWITVDQTVSLHDGERGVTLACPDAPLVQVGDFNFGKESNSIGRPEKPLLLAWPMNNYWDTNFWMNQPGRVQFKYELSPFDEFKETEVYQAGVSASDPVAMNASIDCATEEIGQLLSYKSEEVIPLYVKPAEDRSGMVVTLRNLVNEPANCRLAIPDKKIVSATIVNTLEEDIKNIEMTGDEVQVELQGRQVIRLKLNID